MAQNYPDPSPAKSSRSTGVPYFVPGLETQINYEDSLPESPPKVPHLDSDEDSDEDEHSDEDVVDLELTGLVETVAHPIQDPDFDPSLSDVDADFAILSDTSLEPEGNRANEWSQKSSRGRPRGSRSRGRRITRGTRGAHHDRDSVVSFDVLQAPGPHKRGRLIPRGEGRGARRGRRGPNIVRDVGYEFKDLQNQATQAFVAQKWDDCEDLCKRALELNPEIFFAHSLLSQVYFEQGRTHDSLEVLFHGAFTVRDASVWWEVAQKVHEVLAEDDAELTQRLIQVYKNILRLDRHDIKARLERIKLYQKVGTKTALVNDCQKVLKAQSDNLPVLRILAEESLNTRHLSEALAAYQTAITHYLEIQSEEEDDGFTFHDLNSYADLLKDSGHYEHGLQETKRLARWLLGRKDESYWDEIKGDDREWDDEDESRRNQISDFTLDRFRIEQYGQGLPPDLRVKMGLFRLNMGVLHFEEAMRHFRYFDPKHDLPAELVEEFDDLIKEIAEALHKNSYYSEALDFFEALRNSFPRLDPLTARRAGESAQVVGNESLALEYYSEAIKSRPRDAELRLRLAAIYERQGNPSLVKFHFGEVIGIESPLTTRKLSIRESDAVTLLPYAASKAGANVDLLNQQSLQDGAEIEDSGLEDNDAEEDDNERQCQTPQLNKSNITPQRQLELFLHRMMWRTRPSGRYARFQPSHRAQQATPVEHVIESRTDEPLQDSQPSEKPELDGSSITDLHSKLKAAEARIDAGDEQAKYDYTNIAEHLIDAFFTQRSFFMESNGRKRIAFLGFTAEDRHFAITSAPRSEEFFLAYGEYIMQPDTSLPLPPDNPYHTHIAHVPRRFGDVSFDEWLTIFLQYILNLCTLDSDPAWQDVFTQLYSCIIFIHHPPSLFAIKVAQLACAIHIDDKPLCSTLLRWFVMHHPLHGNAYQLYPLVNRILPGPNPEYSHSAQLKFFNRYVKARDHLALDAAQRKETPFNGIDLKPIASKRLDSAPADAPIDLDHHLLLLAGSLITANGTHPTNAINYYLRAHIVAPTEPLPLLCAGVAYLQMAIRRVAVHRHYEIASGMALIQRYRALRLRGRDGEPLKPGRLRRQREQETLFNLGRAWHAVGLMHWAVECYEGALAVGEATESGGDVDMAEAGEGEDDDEGVLWDEPDFRREAALALQMILVHSGDAAGARRVGEQFLVF